MKVNMIKTDTMCFISDCNVVEGYNYSYHNSKIADMLFDGNKPKQSYFKNWFIIEQYPKTVQQFKHLSSINKRYEISDKEMISNKLPQIILYEERDNFDKNIFSLYSYFEDKQEPIIEDVSVEFDIILEVNNFELPLVIDYKAIRQKSFNNEEFKITNVDVKHQLLDKIIFPEVMLHTRPCSISSYDLYCLVRQYIKDNIDTKVAKITSDYNFCFTVKKVIPLYEPENITYQNIFAKSKKDRNKTHFVKKIFKEVEVFEMTNDKENYKGYTVIQPIFANNENELKTKIDEFLEHLIILINKPLKPCEHCKGHGYFEYF